MCMLCGIALVSALALTDDLMFLTLTNVLHVLTLAIALVLTLAIVLVLTLAIVLVLTLALSWP